MKSLEQELVESKADLKKLSCTKPVVDDRSVSISIKPKDEKFYIPPFKRNLKEKAYFARLDKGKSSDIDAKFLNLSLNLLLNCRRNLFLCLLVIFVVLLIILDQIVLY